MDWLGDNLWAMWLAVAALLLIGEMASLDLFMLMLSVGAGAAAISTIWVDQWEYQLLIAAVVAVACIGLIRPGLLHRLHAGPTLLVGPERMIGVLLTTPVALNDEFPSQVKIGGEWWGTRVATGQPPVAPGTQVHIIEISGATAIVAPVAEKE